MTGRRSPAVQQGIRVISPLAIVTGVFLLFAGHNNPGGGFAAGLVFGAVVILRAIAGIQRLSQASALISAGVLLIAAVGILPLLWGDSLLDQQLASFELPVLGTVKTGTALPFDIGVSIVVVGLVTAMIDGLSGSSREGPRPQDEGNGP